MKIYGTILTMLKHVATSISF